MILSVVQKVVLLAAVLGSGLHCSDSENGAPQDRGPAVADAKTDHTSPKDGPGLGFDAGPDRAISDRGADQSVDAALLTDWREVSTPLKGAFRKIWGVVEDGKTWLFAVGPAGLILVYDGASWTQATLTEKEDVNGVFGFSAKEVYAVGKNMVQRFDGTKWENVYKSPFSFFNDDLFNAVWGIKKDDKTYLWAVGTEGRVGHQPGADAAWKYQDVPIGEDDDDFTADDLNAVWGRSITEVYAVGANGGIFKYDGSTDEFTPITSPVKSDLQAMWGSSTDLYAVGFDGVVVHNAGTTWDSMNPTSSSYFYGVSGVDKTLFIAGHPIFEPTQSSFRHDGSNWTKLDSGKYLQFNGVWALSATDAYAVGPNGVFHYGPAAK